MNNLSEQLKELTSELKEAANRHDAKTRSSRDEKLYFHGACYAALMHAVKRIEEIMNNDDPLRDQK